MMVRLKRSKERQYYFSFYHPRLFQPLFLDNFLLVQNFLFNSYIGFICDREHKLVIVLSLIEDATLVENAELSSRP